MTTFTAPLPPQAAARTAPTRGEQLLLTLTRAIETAMVRRMQRRAHAPLSPGSDAVEDRRTAQALGAVGILPR